MIYFPIETKAYLPTLTDWIATYSSSEPIGGFEWNINVIEFDANAAPGSNMMDYAGRQPPSIQKDILGNQIFTITDNFILYIRRRADMDFERVQGANFLQAFNDWVTWQTINGLTPKFGNTMQHDETIYTSSGMQWQDVEGQAGVIDYMWQISLTYHLEYRINFLQQAFKNIPQGGN